MSDTPAFSIDDLIRAGEAIKRMPATPPMRWACSFDEAKALILAGHADMVLVNTRVLAELEADAELQSLKSPSKHDEADG